MRIDILTLFPEMCEQVLSESIIGRAREGKVFSAFTHNIRDYSNDKHRRVDDTPYGGGMGMLMQAQPIYDCFESIALDAKSKPHFIYMSPQGKPLTQERAVALSKLPHIAILCGHYEGVDARLIDEIVDEEISIGDYVLTGGELPALVLTDAVVRMLPGTLSNETAYQEESHYNGLLEYPQYTRPYEWRGREVPEVLISGHHANIEKWRKKESLRLTKERRPDLFEVLDFTKEEQKLLIEIEQEEKKAQK